MRTKVKKNLNVTFLHGNAVAGAKLPYIMKQLKYEKFCHLLTKPYLISGKIATFTLKAHLGLLKIP